MHIDRQSLDGALVRVDVAQLFSRRQVANSSDHPESELSTAAEQTAAKLCGDVQQHALAQLLPRWGGHGSAPYHTMSVLQPNTSSGNGSAVQAKSQLRCYSQQGNLADLIAPRTTPQSARACGA